MSDIELVKKVRGYAEEAEKNGFEVLTVPLRDLFPLLGRMEAAERERDELRLGIARIGGAKAIEVLQRDAAAGGPVDNPVLGYADSYRGMASRGVENVPIWGVITILERFIAPLCTTPPAASVPDGLAAAVNRLLDSDGSRGSFSAIRRGDALAEVERLLAAAPAPGGDGGDQS